MKRLYAVVIERTIMVMAETDREAEELAERHERDECENQPDFIYANPATKGNLPKEWWDSLPYGGDGKATCKRIFEEQQQQTV